jgi:uncharacterized protein YjbJ (UPF0337 family)
MRESTLAHTVSHPQEIPMNWDQINGNGKHVTGRAKERWGELTDNDLDIVVGRRDQLAGKIQERCGVAKEEAERQLATCEDRATESWFSKDA